MPRATLGAGAYSSWKGPSVPEIVLYCLVLAAFSLAISYMAINGLPKGMLSWGKNKFPVAGKTIIVTGGSQGMGLEAGNVFSHKGANVVLVARNSAKLEKAVDYISKSAPNPEKQRFHWISADVTDPLENERIIREVTEWNNGSPPDIVWANAGASVPGYFLDMPLETLRAQMDLNYWPAVYLARTTFKTWLNSSVHRMPGESGHPPPRHFLMTSSVAAFAGLAGYTAYSPAKAAMRSLHDQLRSELQLYNGYLDHPENTTIPKIKVHTIFPGTILSPGLEKENETKPPALKMLEEGDPAQKPLEIAREVVRQLEKGRSLITTYFLGHAMKGSSWMGSVRDNPVRDTLMSWVVNVVWCFVAPDMERKVQKWGRENGMTLKPEK